MTRDGQKIWYTYEWGKSSGERKAAGIFTYTKPKDLIQKNHNREALALLEQKIPNDHRPAVYRTPQICPSNSKKRIMEISLDQDDRCILHLLQHDAQLTAKEIADKINKSPSAIAARINKLQSNGIIRKYVVLIDKTRVAKSLTAITNVQLKEHAQSALANFEREACKFPEVMECYHLTGEYDFLLKVAIADMNEYNLFLRNKLATLPNIGTVQTHFVLSESKLETAYDIAPSAPPSAAPKMKK